MKSYRVLTFRSMFTRHTALQLMEMLEDRAYDEALPRNLMRLAEQLVTDFSIGKRYIAIWPDPESQP